MADPDSKKTLPKKTKKKIPKGKVRKLNLDASILGETGYSGHVLDGLEEDIVIPSSMESLPLPPISTVRILNQSFTTNTRRSSLPTSENSTQLFVEGKRKFITKTADEIDKEKEKMKKTLLQTRDPTENSSSPRSFESRYVNLIQIAINYQRVFTDFSHFLHGILAGFAMWQCVILLYFYVICAMDHTNGELEMIFGLYSVVCKPINCAYLLLLTITLLAALDSIDIASPEAHLLIFPRYITLSSTLRALLIPVILLAFIVNNVLMEKDTRINIMGSPIGLNFTKGLNETELKTARQLISTWCNLNIVRGVAAFLSWCLVAINSSQKGENDMQIKTLEKRKKELLEAENQ